MEIVWRKKHPLGSHKIAQNERKGLKAPIEPLDTKNTLKMNQDNYYIKISGKAELPKAIEIGHNYDVALSGSIVSETISDNDDGSKTHAFTFKPIKVEVLTDKGEMIKAKDTRGFSQLFRSRVWSIWSKSNSTMTYDEYYDKLYQNMIRYADEVVGQFMEDYHK